MSNDDELFKFMYEEEKKNPGKLREDIETLISIRNKYQVNAEDIFTLSIVLMELGYGRNSDTANILRAVADMIESPIQTRDTLEAKMKNKLQ